MYLKTKQMENFELKNFVHYKRMSHETNCFTAKVYFKGMYIADASNDGQGSETCIYVNHKNRELFNEAYEYASKLPPIVYSWGEIPSSLIDVIDKLCIDISWNKSLKKYEKNGIIFTIDDVMYHRKFKLPIVKIIAATNGIELLKKEIDEIKEKGGKILNTNLANVY